MAISKSLSVLAFFLALFTVATCGAAADPTPIQPTNRWMGSNRDETAGKEMPANGVITTAKEFEKLIKAWNVAEKAPEVDFENEIVLVATTRGGRLSLNASLEENGNLKALAIATRDLRPGFRYVILSVPKKGIKTVNGKELPE
jgi:hypothetical protein